MILSLSACADKHYERIIVIDGHGGVDPGAIGRASKYSGEGSRPAYGSRLALPARGEGRCQVIMTRVEDRIVGLRGSLADRQAEPGRLGERAQGEWRIRLHAVGAGLKRRARALGEQYHPPKRRWAAIQPED
jgi:N-acetylmuramoyl-L-alanine amidase